MSNFVSIHQPNFLPWPGYWLKQATADSVVVFATCQLNNAGYTRRVKYYKNINKPAWLSVPLYGKITGKLISETIVNNHPKLQFKLVQTIDATYRHLPHYDSLRYRIRDHLNAMEEFPDLAMYNLALAQALSPTFLQNLNIVKDSSLELSIKNGPLKLVEICEKLKASRYISGLGARDYLKEDHFSATSTALTWFDGVAATKEIFPEVPTDESVLHIISLIGEQSFANRLFEFGERYSSQITGTPL